LDNAGGFFQECSPQGSLAPHAEHGCIECDSQRCAQQVQHERALSTQRRDGQPLTRLAARYARSVDQRLQRVFGVRLCGACKERPEHKLVTKSEAMARLLLTEGDFSRAKLPFLDRPCTTYKPDGRAHMYLLSQLAAVALTKHGDADALERKRCARSEAQVQRHALKKRKSAASALEEAEEGAYGELQAKGTLAPLSSARPRATPAAAGARRLAAANEAHVHSYSGTPVFDEQRGSHCRACDACGAESYIELM